MSDRMIKSLYRTIEMKEALIKQFKSRIAELEEHNAVLREALKEVKPEIRPYFDDLYELIDKALALTPSDAVERARKKDELLKGAYKIAAEYAKDNPIFYVFNKGEAQECDPAGVWSWLEAARSAGVEVE